MVLHKDGKGKGRLRQKHGFVFNFIQWSTAGLELLPHNAEELSNGNAEHLQMLYNQQDVAVHGAQSKADLKGSLLVHSPRHDATVVQGLAC